MTVYVLQYYSDHEHMLVAVHSSMEEANNNIKEMVEDDWFEDFFTVEKFEVDRRSQYA